MGETDFIGHFDIEPPLNEAEVAFLADWSRSRHWKSRRGPYRTGRGPEETGDPPAAFDVPGEGQPSLWCRWTPSPDGSELHWDGDPDFDEPAAWLRYLVKQFLGRTAVTRDLPVPLFTGFTYDHVVSGAVVGRRRGDRRLFALKVSANRVSELVLRLGDGEAPAKRRATPPRGARAREAATVSSGVVIDLASRRHRMP